MRANSDNKAFQLLLVDDDKDVLQATAMLMEMDDIEVSTALTAEDALGHLQARSFDAILVDLFMAPMDGEEFARAARAAGYRGRLVAFSGLPADVGPSFDGLVLKPARAAQILEAIGA